MRRLFLLMPAVILVASPAAFAAVSEADIEQMREQLAAMSQRLDELAVENAELRRAQAQAATNIADVQTSVAEVAEALDRTESALTVTSVIATKRSTPKAVRLSDATGFALVQIFALTLPTMSRWASDSQRVAMIRCRRTRHWATVAHRKIYRSMWRMRIGRRWTDCTLSAASSTIHCCVWANRR